MYAAVVKEDVPAGFRTYVFMLRSTGVWRSPNDSVWFKLWSLTYFLTVGILFPFSLFMNVFFADSIQDAMNHFYLPMTQWSTALKVAIIYWRCDNIRDLFRIHAKLVHADSPNTDRHNRIARTNFRIHVLLPSLYLTSCCAFNIQSVFSKPEEGLFPSTALLPYEFAKQRSVYLSVFGYQVLTSFGNVYWTAMMDSFFIAFINTVCSHVTEMKERLRNLGAKGTNEIERESLFYAELIDCCKRYNICLR